MLRRHSHREESVGHHGGHGHRSHRGPPREHPRRDGPEPFGHRGPGGRGRRFLEGGDLRLLLLALIAERPRHGYELIKEIEERTGGGYSPSPGVIYPTLTLLEELGQIAVSATAGTRKLFAVTPDGEAALAADRAGADALLTRLDAAAGGRPAGAGPQLTRAVHNLRTALRLRMSRGEVTPETLERIVATLDAAARSIERD